MVAVMVMIKARTKITINMDLCFFVTILKRSAKDGPVLSAKAITLGISEFIATSLVFAFCLRCKWVYYVCVFLFILRTCTHAYTNTHTRTCIRTYIQANKRIRTNTHTRTNVRTHIRTHTYTQTHTHAHTHTHTHTHLCMRVCVYMCVNK